MKDGPDFTRIASLIGDPARANMLTALMSGKALTATELSQEAGVTLQTASSHLKQLAEGGLLELRKQGRHRYYSLASDDVAQLLENLMGLAAGAGHTRTRTGPRNEELRKARVCYNHLAGHMGIELYDRFKSQGFVHLSESGLDLTAEGTAFVTDFGIDVQELKSKRAPVCRECLDWSERRSHLAGGIGRALLARIEELGWARRVPKTRIIRFTSAGEQEFNRHFGN